jgi:hypothetical protein
VGVVHISTGIGMFQPASVTYAQLMLSAAGATQEV